MSRVSQARSLGKYFLLVDNMLVVLGFFVVFPLISIRFVDQMGWAALMVGIALGLRQLVQQGLGIFGGAIADRFGAKPMIVTGMLMRAAGFAAMAVAHEPWVLWLSSSLIWSRCFTIARKELPCAATITVLPLLSSGTIS